MQSITSQKCFKSPPTIVTKVTTPSYRSSNIQCKLQAHPSADKLEIMIENGTSDMNLLNKSPDYIV